MWSLFGHHFTTDVPKNTYLNWVCLCIIPMFERPSLCLDSYLNIFNSYCSTRGMMSHVPKETDRCCNSLMPTNSVDFQLFALLLNRPIHSNKMAI